MNHRTQKGMFLISAAAVSVVAVLAFSAGSTGARTLTASVVNDADAFLALDANPASPHKGFVRVTEGKVSISFDSANADVAGKGLNPGSAYMFDSVLRITNKGTSPANVDVVVTGADASLCAVALTATTSQTDADYSGNPAPLASSVGSVSYLGLRMSAEGKAAGAAVDCTLTVVAAR